MNISSYRHIYFIGIGGIGMSALARFFAQRGVQVSGYDRTETALTSTLAAEGMSIGFKDEEALADRDADLVVYTPAIPKDNKIFNWYKDNNYPVYKRSDVLQWITEAMFAVTVAGTHGKTTISTMVAYLLRETGYGCNAFLGGISNNYNSNYWSSANDTAVVEADEYDRSFLKLSPDLAVLTSVDADHLDIYGTVEELEAAFIQYTRNIKPGGSLLVKHGLHRGAELRASKTRTYSLQNNVADCYASDIVQKDGGYNFAIFFEGMMTGDVRLSVGGMHNVENAVAAFAVTQILGIPAPAVKAALAGFKGIRRRFDYVLRNDQIVFIDDYAHHPEELSALINSAKRLFPNRRCVIAFQPHLFSRTRDLAHDFARSLDEADEVILLEIYPARELPMEGVSAQMIADRMSNPAHTVLSKEALIDYVKTAPLDLFITAGAGDIDKLVQPLKDAFQNKTISNSQPA